MYVIIIIIIIIIIIYDLTRMEFKPAGNFLKDIRMHSVVS